MGVFFSSEHSVEICVGLLSILVLTYLLTSENKPRIMKNCYLLLSSYIDYFREKFGQYEVAAGMPNFDVFQELSL